MQRTITYRLDYCLQYLLRQLHKEDCASIYLYINLQTNIKLI